MRALTWWQLTWPREVPAGAPAACFRQLSSTRQLPLIIRTISVAGSIEHRVGAPAGLRLDRLLHGQLPGLGVAAIAADHATARPAAVWRLRLSSGQRPLWLDEPEQVVGSLLSALSAPRHDERLVLEWRLGRPQAPQVVPQRSAELPGEGWWGQLLRAPWQAPQRPDPESRRARQTKQALPGWRVIGRLAVWAATDQRRRQLLGGVLSSLRSAESPGLSVYGRTSWRRDLERPPLWPVTDPLNAAELAVLAGWPAGSTRELPVEAARSRQLPAPRSVPTRGRIVAVAGHQGQRPLAIPLSDSLRHLELLGPTGVGKSTVMLSLITQDLAAGRGVVVVDPKGDLITDVLARVPDERLDDVVLIEAGNRDRVVGLNPLALRGTEPEAVADGLLAVFHGLYADAWGIRTQDILSASLLTLVGRPEASLAAVPLLLSNPAFRRRVVGGLGANFALAGFWRWFEDLSEPERLQAIGPVMNKLRGVLVRPSLRRILGQPAPRFDLGEVFTRRRVLLVNLARAHVGPDSAQLLGSLVIASLWQTIQRRATVPADKRHPVFVYLDEFADYLRLPIELGDALTQARGLGVGLTLAHQHLDQLPQKLRSAVLANAQNRLIFRLDADDAAVMAKRGDGRLSAEDFTGLGAFEVYADLSVGGSRSGFMSARTSPPSQPLRPAEAVRRASLARYGRAVTDIDEALEALGDAPRQAAGETFGAAPRAPGGTP